jgi:uncharacterized protein (TIGR03437 family)
MAGTYTFGGGSLASAEIYDPEANAFMSVDPMISLRANHTATLLNDGRVLIAGGSARGITHSSAELYTPGVLTPSPQLFSVARDRGGQGAIWHGSTGKIASPHRPAVPGEVLSMYTTSMVGANMIPPQVAGGGLLPEIVYFGDAPGYPGYNQVNFRVPAGVTTGSAVTVRLIYLGRPSNEVTIGVQ